LITQGDPGNHMKVTRQQMAALADSWFDKLDTDKTGKVNQADSPRASIRR